MQTLIQKEWDGPNGVHANFVFRPDTADENTINATFKEDEYHFVNFPPAPGEWMIDAGGYVGSTALLYAKLFPSARVICIEPLPENLEIIENNVRRNGLQDRITILPLALSGVDGEIVKIFYRDDSLVGKIHRFVGSAYMNYHETVSDEFAAVKSVSLNKIIDVYKIPSIRLLKMDIEGSENAALQGMTIETLQKIQTIVGEYHNVDRPGEIAPRTLLYRLVEQMFEDKSTQKETETWGAFLFEKRR
jgi:FkbM family methyltransferase